MLNTTAMFYTFVAFMKLLDAGNTSEKSPTRGQGMQSQFIATSSIGAYSRRPGAGFSYAGSKAAAIHIVKQLATWMVPYHIRANTIAPGIYPSDMSAVSMARYIRNVELTVAVYHWNVRYLERRLCTREHDSCSEKWDGRGIGFVFISCDFTDVEKDVAGATLFLCSRAGGYINGNVLLTDGGRLSIFPASY
jgi:NAD(P)-dependent dehydrogenase (short-subunit alcohol dehydrogenase family)